MAKNKKSGPPMTWTLFKRNVRLWMTWPYLMSFAFVMAIGHAYRFPPYEWHTYVDNLGAWSNTVSMLLFGLVFFGIPAVPLYIRYRSLKDAGYRFVWNAPGSDIYWLPFLPLGVSTWPWIENRLPFLVNWVLVWYIPLHMHIVPLSTSTFSESDFQQSINDTEEGTFEALEKDSTSDAPQDLMTFEIYKLHVLRSVNRPLERTMLGLTILGVLLMGCFDLEGKCPKIGDTELTKWWTAGPIYLLVTAPALYIVVAYMRLYRRLKKSAYKETRNWLHAMITLGHLEFTMRPWLRYIRFQPLAMGFFWVANSAIFLIAIWLGRWKLEDEGTDEKSDSPKEEWHHGVDRDQKLASN